MTRLDRTTTFFLALAASALATVCATAVAHADPASGFPDRLAVHLTAGAEGTGGQGAIGGGFRGTAGLGWQLGRGHVRPEVGGGVVFGGGAIGVDDPRALDGTLELSYWTVGPQAQLGLRIGDGGRFDTRVFATGALLKVGLDDRLRFDHVPGVSGSPDRGVRASLGANWVGPVWRDCDHTQSCMITGLLPNQAELVYEQDAGSARVGVALSWGI